MNHLDLIKLLRQRIEIIADHDLRERDPDAQLEALKSVSESIERYHQTHGAEFDARLQHFMAGCSYEKALRYLESEGSWRGH